MSEKKESTSVQTVDIDVDELLAIPGADTVMTPEEGAGSKKKTVFSNPNPDTTFLDKPANPGKVEKSQEELDAEKKAEEEAEAKRLAAEEEANKGKTPEEIEAAKKAADEAAAGGDDFLKPGAELEDDEKNKGGRPSALITATKKLIEKGTLLPFEDDKKVEDYTAEDLQELIEVNFQQKEEQITNEVPKQFFKSLPPEMQQAYTYIANGGTDLKGMFSTLAASNEVRDLDMAKEGDQKYAIRAYLQATNYGTPEEIEDEILSLEDRGEIEKKANQFKPKLDAMQQQIVNQQLAEQESQAKQRQEQSQKYIESVYSTLETAKLNGVDLDTKTQNMLYAGLVQSNYPSSSGKQTNMLGHLLEKYQWIEPRHDLIAEALWLLADPEGYRTSIGGKVEEAAAQKTLRTLKTEQSSKTAGNQSAEEEETMTRKRSGVQRPKRNFFGR